MSTLVGVLKTWRDMYLTAVQDADVPVIKKIMTPIIALLVVVSVISAVLLYFIMWIKFTTGIFILHSIIGMGILIFLIAKACGGRFHHII